VQPEVRIADGEDKNFEADMIVVAHKGCSSSTWRRKGGVVVQRRSLGPPHELAGYLLLNLVLGHGRRRVVDATGSKNLEL
jgi:hypothetical protein